MKRSFVKFKFKTANNPSMREKIIESPDPGLLDLTIGTIIEINFENDAYYADFKIVDKHTNLWFDHTQCVDMEEYTYTIEYIPRTTRTRTQQENIHDKP